MSEKTPLNELLLNEHLLVDPDVLQCVKDAFNSLWDSIVAAIEPVVKVAAKWLTDDWEKIERTVVPPKWWRLYKRSKKIRVRKKYHKMSTQAAIRAFNSKD